MSRIVNYVVQEDTFFDSEDVSLRDGIRLKQWIKSYLRHCVTVKKIVKIQNQHLYAAFQVQKRKLGDCQVVEVLHSTAASNLDSIKKGNLDWRRVVRAKYGYGTSFSKNADYANFHSSFAGGNERVFVVCDILVKQTKYVSDNKDMFPGDSADTYISANGHVYVKFDDFTYYPKYALYYTKPPHTSSRFWRRKRGSRY